MKCQNIMTINSNHQLTNTPGNCAIHWNRSGWKHIEASRWQGLQLQRSTSNTLPETNMFAPENGWLEDDRFLIREVTFQGQTVSFREGMYKVGLPIPY